MKKNLCAVFLMLVFLLSLPCISSAMSEEEGYQYIHDLFASHTDEDLKNLLAAIHYELTYRGYTVNLEELNLVSSKTNQKEVTVPPGTYAVGIDIPEGEYTVCTNGIISMLTVKDIRGNYVTMHSMNANTQVGKLILEDGQYVEIVGESVIFKPYQGLGF